MIKKAIALFQRSYLASFEKLYPEPALFEAATLLFELQRTAVVLTMQKGKVNLARQRMPIARDWSLGKPLANRISLPLLEMEKRCSSCNLPANYPGADRCADLLLALGVARVCYTPTDIPCPPERCQA